MDNGKFFETQRIKHNEECTAVYSILALCQREFFLCAHDNSWTAARWNFAWTCIV